MTDSMFSKERLITATQDWSRRDLLRGAGALGVVGGSVLLGGCGVGGGSADTATTAAAGPAAVTFEEALKSKSIKVGYAEEAPWAFVDENGKLTGAAPTVVRAVLKRLGIDNVEGEATQFDIIIDNLRAKKYALTAAGLYINPGRCKTSQFAIPDIKVGLAFLVEKGNPKNIKSFQDIVDTKAKVACVSGVAGVGYMKAAGIPDSQIQLIQADNDGIRSIQNKDVDCYLVADISGRWVVKTLPNSNLEITESFQATDKPDLATFNFRLGDDAFRDAFNKELLDLHKSGEWLKLVEPFGFTKANDTYPDLATPETTSKYCELT